MNALILAQDATQVLAQDAATASDGQLVVSLDQEVGEAIEAAVKQGLADGPRMDLGRWLGEEYRVPARQADEQEDELPADQHPERGGDA